MYDLREEETFFSGKAGDLAFHLVVVPDELIRGRRNALGGIEVVGFVKSRMKAEAQPIAVGGKFRFVAVGKFIKHKAAVLVAFEQIEQKFGLILIMQFFQIGKIKVVKDGFVLAGSIFFEEENVVVNKKTVLFHVMLPLSEYLYCSL